MDRTHDDAYLKYVTARFSAFRNVWWTMANEYDFFTTRWIPIKEPKDWDHIFQMVRDHDPYTHLRGIHNAGPWYDHAQPWVSHCIIQEQHQDLYRVAADARKKYGKPVVIDEYGYEGDNGNGWGTLSGAEEVNRHWAFTMAGAYGSHGETYVHPGDILWWGVGGELVGDSVARLGFLKQIMIATPYEDMEPSPDLVTGGTALAKRGSYYLFRFVRSDKRNPFEINIDATGRFHVDMIDPWLMKVYPLGATPGGKQKLIPHIAPGLLRVVREGQARADEPTGSIEELIAKFGSSMFSR